MTNPQSRDNPALRYLPEFSGWLAEQGAVPKTVKNYVSDVRRFLVWLEEKFPDSKLESLEAGAADTYLADLALTGSSPNTVQRKRASLRRFSDFWAATYSGITPVDFAPKVIASATETRNNPIAAWDTLLRRFELALVADDCKDSTVKNYVVDVGLFAEASGNLPPYEIFTKTRTDSYLRNLRFEGLTGSTISRKKSSLSRFAAWALQEELLDANPFVTGLAGGLDKVAEVKEAVVSKFAPLGLFEGVARKNAPLGSTLEEERAKVRSSRQETAKGAFLPNSIANLYRAYSAARISSYIHLAILVIFSVAIGLLAYQQFGPNAADPFAYPSDLTRPGRILSFQGRVTDTSGTPITAAINMEFRLYNDDTVGTQLWDSTTCSIDPDQDGVFSTLLGDTCGAEIDENVFSENSEIWLEVQVGSETLSPRQRIASVAYALNAETLQGFPPSLGGEINTIPVINALGEVIIGANNPSLIASSGAFLIQAESMTFQTEAGSAGDITFAPDAGGTVNILSGTTSQDSLYISNANLTSGNLIHGYVGNDSGTGNLLYLGGGSSETIRLAVSKMGDLFVGRAATVSGSLNVDSGTLFVDEVNNRVGIGTSAPGFTLDVNGNARLGDGSTGTQLTIDGTDGDLTIDNGSIISTTRNTLWFNYATPKIHNFNNGQLTLGTSGQLGLTGSLNGITLADRAGSSDSFAIYNSGGTFRIWEGSDLFVIQQNTGNVGVGDTSPASLFTVGASDAFQINSSGNIVAIGGAAQSIANVSNDLVFTAVDDLVFNDVRTGDIPLSVTDTGINVALTQGIVDAINEVYDLANGTGGGLWYLLSGTFVQKNTTADVLIGGTASSSAGIRLGADGGAVFNEQGNDADFRIEGDTDANLFFVDASTGRIGIGTNAPSRLFDVLSTTSPQARISYSTSRYLDMGVDSAGTVTFSSTQPNDGTTSFILNSSNNQSGNLLEIQHPVTGDVLTVSNASLKTPSNIENITSGANLTIKAQANLKLRSQTTGVEFLNSSAVTVAHIATMATNNSYFTIGNVGIGDTTPASLFTVGNGDLFQVNSSGIIAALDGVAHTIDDNSGNLRFSSNSSTIEFADSLNVTGGITASGTITANGGLITRDTGNLTLSTTTSGDLSLDSAGELYFSDVRTGNIPFTIADTALHVDLTQGVIDAINDTYEVALNGASKWTLASGALYPNNPTTDVLFGGTSSASAKFAFLNVNSGTPTASVSAGVAGATYLRANGTLATTAMQDLTFGSSTTGALRFAPAGTERMTITQAGNVGIGTTSPATKLQVSGNVNISSTTHNNYPLTFGTSTGKKLALYEHTSGDGSSFYGFGISSGRLDIYSSAATSADPNMVITSSGAVGIGTTAPDARLDSLATTGEQLRLTYTDGSVYSGFTVSSAGNLTIDSTGTYTAITDDLQVNGGDIGISADTDLLQLASGAFTINGTTQANGNITTTGTLTLPNSNTLTGVAGYTQFSNGVSVGGGTTYNINSSGTGNLNALTLAGTLTANGGLITRGSGNLTLSTTTSGDLTLDSAGELYFNDVRTGNIPFSVVDTAINGDLGQGIIDAINDTYDFALNNTGLWELANGALYPKNSTLDALIGGSASSSASIRLGADGGAVFNEQGNDVDFRIESDTDANALFVDGTTGSIGIGTTTTTERLNIHSSGTTSRMNFTHSSASAGALFGLNGTDFYAWNRENGNTYFGTNDTARMGISPSGGVGIGSSYYANNTPANNLVVQGSVGIGTTGPDAKLDALATSGEQLRLTYTDGSVYSGFTVSSAGNLTIDSTGTYTALTDDLQVNGGDIGISADTDLLQLASGAFTVNGTTQANGNITTTGTLTLPNSNTLTGVASYTQFSNGISVGGGTTFRIDSSGNAVVNDLSIQGNTTIGDASTDTVTVNSNAWTFANDTNFALTGGVNGLSFDTDTLSIDATNNRVGIGTTAPGVTLEAQSTTQQLRLRYDASNYVGLSVTSSSNLDFYTNANQRGQFSNGRWFGTGYGGSDLTTFSDINDTNTGISFISADKMSLMTGGSHRLTVDSTGNVGIGDTSPASMFTVGAGDLFQVNSSGIIATIDGVAHTIDDVSGNLTLTSNSTTVSVADALTVAGTITANGGLVTRAAGALDLTTTTSGDITVSSAGELYFSDTRTGNIPFSVTDTALDGSLPQGIVDAINYAYNAALTSGGIWKLETGAYMQTNTTADVLMGGDSTASAKFAFTNFSSGTPTAIFNGDLNVTGNTTLGDASGDTLTLNSSTVAIPNNLNFDSNTFFIDASTNRIGIGDTSPAAALTVGAADAFQINSSGEIAQIDGVAHTLTDSSGNLAINSNGAAVVIVDDLQVNGGDIGISADTDLLQLASGAFTINGTTQANGDITTTGTFTLPNTNTLTGVASYTQFSQGISVGGATTYNIASTGTATLNAITAAGTITANGGLITRAAGNLTVSTTTSGDLSLDSAGELYFSDTRTGNIPFSLTDTALDAGLPQGLLDAINSTYDMASNGDEWTIANGAFYPNNNTTDVLLGGTSTASAKFAFTNIDSGTPTMLVSDGSATTSLTATGILNVSTGSLNLATGGTNRLTIASGGNVGIGGDTTPDSLFSVGSTSQFQIDGSGDIVALGGAAHSIFDNSGDLTFSSAGLMYFDDSNLAAPVKLTNSATSLTASGGGIIDAINNAYDSAILWTRNAGTSVLYPTTTTDNILFGGTSVATAKFRIDQSNGNLYIGTEQHLIQASTILDGYSVTQDVLKVTPNANYFQVGADLIVSGGDIYGPYTSQLGISPSISLLDMSSVTVHGNLGIGTTNPQAKLDIAGASSTITATAGDLTLNAYSNLVSLSGDSLSNFAQASGSAGTATRPTFSFSTEPSTGMFLSGTNQIGFATDGTNRFTLSLDGIIPVANNTYDVGSSTNRIRDLFLGPASLHMGSSGDEGVISFNTTTDQFEFDRGLTVDAGMLVDLSNIIHDTATIQGFKLPQGASLTAMTGAGEGYLAWDSTDQKVKVFDGTNWVEVGPSILSDTDTLDDGEYLEIIHNQNTADLLATGWIYDTNNSQWKMLNAGVELVPDEFGDGSDGDLAPSGDFNINTGTSNGRTYADGIAYRVTAPADSATSVTRYSGSDTLSNGIAAGDEVLLINLQGTSSDNADVGNYEFMTVSSVSSTTITFTTAITKSFNGTSAANQKVAVQRVPHYSNVTLDAGEDITAQAWDALASASYTPGRYATGLIAMRVQTNTTVTSGSSINADTKGFQGGTGAGSLAGGISGESYEGINGAGGAASTGTGTCGGGGGEDSTGTNTTCVRGGGGGGGGNNSDTNDGAGGGGGGTYGTGGGGGGSGANDSLTGGTGGSAGSTTGGGGGGGTQAGSDGGNGGSAGGGSAGGAAGSGTTSGTGGRGINDATGGGGGGGSYGTSDLSKLYHGSGGGQGGDGPDAGAPVGGSAGGIVFLMSRNINGTGTISANGSAGASASSQSGAGGGGAGGSVKIVVNESYANITVQALGGSTSAASTTSGGGGAGGAGRVYLGFYDSTSLSASPNAYVEELTATGISYENGEFLIVQEDSNTVRLYNHSGTTQEVRLNVTIGGGSGGGGGGSLWTVNGDDIYFNGGNVAIGQTTPTARLDLAGATTALASLRVRAGTQPTTGNAGDLYSDGTNLYFYNGSTWDDLTAGAGSSPVTDAGTYIYPSAGEFLGNSTSAGANKLAGAYFADSAPLTLGTDNDVSFAFSGSTLAATIGNNDINFDSDTFFIDGSADRVGIGIAAPTAYLDITGSATGIDSLRLRSGDTGAAPADSNQILFSYNGTATYTHAIKTRHNAAGLANNAIDFYVWDYSTDAIGTTGTKQVLTLDGTGNVGIGTTSPSDLLSVQGSTRPTISISDGTVADGARLFKAVGNQARVELSANTYFDGTNWNLDNTSNPGTVLSLVNGIFQFRNATAGSNPVTLTESMRITADGNVGIGTTSPNRMAATASATLTLETTDVGTTQTSPTIELSRARSTFESNSEIGVIRFLAGSSPTQLAAIQATMPSTTGIDSDLNFFTTPTGGSITSRMVLNKDGYLGIGDTTPASLFTVGSGDLFQVNTSGIIAAIDGVAHTVDDVSGNLTLTSNSSTVSIADGLTVAGNVLPSADDTYDLGSSTARWQDLFLGPSSLHIGTNGNDSIISYDTTGNLLKLDASGDGTAEMTIADNGNVAFTGTLSGNGSGLTSVAAATATNVAFSGITSATNTTAAMVIGTGGSLTTSGSGSITATDLACTGCVANTELANSGITFAGDTGSSATALGGTRTLAGGTNLTSVESAGTVTVNLDSAVTGLTQLTVDNLRLDGNTLDSTSGNLTLDSFTGTTAINDDITTTGTFTLPNTNTITGVASYTQFSAGISVGGATTYNINSSGTGNLNALTLAGVLAVNGDSITADGATLTINAAGTVDIQDAITVDELTVDGIGTGATFSGTGNHDITASAGTLRFGAATLTGAITGNSQAITGLSQLTVDDLRLDGNTVDTTSGNLTLDSTGGTVAVNDALTVSGVITANGGSITRASGSLALTTTTTGDISIEAADEIVLPDMISCTALETDASGVLTCGTDDSGSASLAVEEGDSSIVAATTNLDFLANDFIVGAVGNEANVSIDYANSGITRTSQAETISGGWTFGTATTTFSALADFNSDVNIADTSIAFDGASTNFNVTGDFTINTDDFVILKAGDITLAPAGGDVAVTGNMALSGTLAVNGDSITADGATLTINAAGAVDIQDNLTADALTIDGTGAGITFTSTGNHDITASAGTLRFGAATLTGAITGNSQAITGLSQLTVDDLRLDGSTLDTTSGNLTLDSTGGTVAVNDALTVSGAITANGGSITRAAGNLALSTTTSGNIVLTSAGNITLTGLNSCTALETDGSGVLSCGSDDSGGGSSQWTTTGSDIYYNTGFVAIGKTTAAASLDVSGTAPGTIANFTNTGTSSSAGGAGMIGYADDGAALASGDRLGFFLLGGAYDGASNRRNAAGFEAFTAETWNSGASGAYLSFLTTATGGNVRSEKMRITADGNVGIGGDTTPDALFSVGSTSQFEVNSSGIIAAIDNVAHTIDDVSGNLTLTSNSSTIAFDDSISTTGTIALPNSNTITGVSTFAQFNNGISVGGGTTYNITSSGNASLNVINAANTINANGGTITRASGNLTVSTTTSGNLTLTSAGSLVLSNFSTNNGLLYTNGTGTVAQTGAGTTGQCLTGNTGSAPTWGSCGGGGGAWSGITDPSGNLSLSMGTNTTSFASTGTTGTAFTWTANSLTSGKGLLVSSTSTALTTGNLAALDWSPGSATTATGDLFSINVGANGTVGSLLNLKNNGTSVFSVGQTQITSAVPHAFTAAGDVSVAYDIVMTNQTSNNIKSYGPLTIASGETFENNNLTLKTYGTGYFSFENGSMGIGSIGAPAAKLQVGDTNITGTNYTFQALHGSITAGWAANAFVVDDTAASNEYILLMSRTGDNEFLFRTDGTALADGAWTGGGADVAELYYVNGSANEGDLVVVENSTQTLHDGKTVKKSTGVPYDNQVLGVVSTNPGLVAGGGNAEIASGIDSRQPIALVGRVPVKVSLENGNIQVGDPLTTSSTPGVAMKATREARIIGFAMENYDGSQILSAGVQNVEQERLSISPENTPLPLPSTGVGKIMIFVNATWHNPDVFLADSGNLSIGGNSGSGYSVSNNGELVSKIGTFAEAAVGELQAGRIASKDIVLDGLDLKTTLTGLTDRLNLAETSLASLNGLSTQTASHSSQLASLNSSLTGLNTSFSTGLLGVGVATPATDSGRLIDTSSGAYLSAGGVWTNVSDVRLKENFVELDAEEMLAKINNLPITRWNYISENDVVTHIGPTAQDFYSAFQTGGDSTRISTIDPAGVALAGIQGLSKQLTALTAEVRALREAVNTGLVDTKNLIAERIQTAQLQTNEVSIQLDSEFSNSGLEVTNEAGETVFEVDENGTTRVDQLITQDMEARYLTTDQLVAESILTNDIRAESAKIDTVETTTLSAREAAIEALQANSASIAGTLRAENIEGNIASSSITDLEERVRSIIGRERAENVDSETENLITEQFEAETNLSGLVGVAVPANATASASGSLLAQGEDVSVSSISALNLNLASTLSIGNEFMLSQNMMAFNVSETCLEDSCQTFFIQPSGEGRLSFLADAMVLSRDGGLQINTDVLVAGRLTAQEGLFTSLIGALPGQDIEINLASAPTEAEMLRETPLEGDTLESNSDLIIRGNNDQEVAAFTASGSARFQKLIIASEDALPDAFATDTSITTNATTGTATIGAGSTEFLIRNSNITDESLIYVTPTSSTRNQVVFVKSKLSDYAGTISTNEAGFIVSVDRPILEDISFNWWIIN